MPGDPRSVENGKTRRRPIRSSGWSISRVQTPVLILGIVLMLAYIAYPAQKAAEQTPDVSIKAIAEAMSPSERNWALGVLHGVPAAQNPVPASLSTQSGAASDKRREFLQVPFEVGLPKGIAEGFSVSIQGVYSKGCFVVDLQNPNQNRIAAHFSVRPNARTVVRNHLGSNSWAHEEHSTSFPFQHMKPFDMRFVVLAGGAIETSVNGEKIYPTARRADALGLVRKLKVHTSCPDSEPRHGQGATFSVSVSGADAVVLPEQGPKPTHEGAGVEALSPPSSSQIKHKDKHTKRNTWRDRDEPTPTATTPAATMGAGAATGAGTGSNLGPAKGELPHIAVCGELWLDEDIGRRRAPECNCKVTKNNCNVKADVRVYGLGSEPKAEAGVLTVGYNMEWNIAGWHDETEGTGPYDMTATYHPKASIPIPYLCTWDLVERFGGGKGPVFDKARLTSNGATAASLVSNCGARERKAYIAKMAQDMPIYNGGGCNIPNTNKLSVRGRWGSDWFRAKNSAVEKHPFYLGFENSNLTDYVTEKLYSGYFSGVIPVFWGTPGVSKVTPPGSYVDANDFDSPEALVKELKAIAADYDRYKSYFDYLPHGLKNKFDELCKDSLMCRICKQSQEIFAKRRAAGEH